MGSFKDCLFAVMITLAAANTLAIGLRVWVRLKMMKVYGWDDLALVVAYLGFMVGCAFGFVTIHFGFANDPDDDTTNFNNEKMMEYYAANQFALYISSGIIKIAVALVLYRLSGGLKSQVILVIAIIVIILWTFITTIFAMGLCASSSAASYTGPVACTAIGYFRMISNVFIDYFLAMFPIPMLWAATLSPRMKIIVCSLLGLGMIASAATVAKLILLVELETPMSPDQTNWIHIQLLIWSDAELGIAIFAATISGLRPLFRRFFGRKPLTRIDNSRPTNAHRSTSGAHPRALANDRSLSVNKFESSSHTAANNGSDSTGDDDDLNSDVIELRRIGRTTTTGTCDRPVPTDEESTLRGVDDEYHASLRQAQSHASLPVTSGGGGNFGYGGCGKRTPLTAESLAELPSDVPANFSGTHTPPLTVDTIPDLVPADKPFVFGRGSPHRQGDASGSSRASTPLPRAESYPLARYLFLDSPGTNGRATTPSKIGTVKEVEEPELVKKDEPAMKVDEVKKEDESD